MDGCFFVGWVCFLVDRSFVFCFFCTRAARESASSRFVWSLFQLEPSCQLEMFVPANEGGVDCFVFLFSFCSAFYEVWYFLLVTLYIY